MQFSDPNGKICALKKLARTVTAAVLANFFLGLFQNFYFATGLICYTCKNEQKQKGGRMRKLLTIKRRHDKLKQERKPQ
jgi:hypothetical protein